jgi:hypothetical protein
MTELGDRLHALADDLARGVELVSPSERPSRQRHHRRTSFSVVVVAVVAVVGIVTVLGAQSDHRRLQVTTQPPASHVSGRGVPVTLPAATHPVGWVPLDFGRARLWAPKGWQAFGPNTCPHGGREVLSGPAVTCHGPAPIKPYLRVEPIDRQVGSGRVFKLNGLRVFPQTKPSGVSVDWAVPSLDVIMQAYGARAESIARTLSPSSLAAVTAAPLPVTIPPSWKAVTYGGLTARVPPNWSTGGLACSGFFTQPSVLEGGNVGAAGCGQNDDNGAFTPTDGLWLEGDRALRPVTLGDAVRRFTVDGHPAVISDPQQGPAIDVEVTLAGQHLYAIVGLGVDPDIAQEVLSSLRTTK